MNTHMEILRERAEALHQELEDEFAAFDGSSRLKDALDYYDAATQLAAICNKIKASADSIKREAKMDGINLLEIEDLDGAPTTIDGQRVNFSKYEFRSARVQNPEEFKAWAESEDREALFEPDLRPRMDVVTALAKELEDNGEEPPPGVVMWRETRLSRTVQP